ncbi:MAG: HEAT repeat domain-containing protein [Myxococcales bacterium]|nr:HEAT repeat domain-containing protein [Myxococcales bacterium]
MSPAPVSSPPEVEEPSVAGLRVRPVWPMVLYVLLVSSAALALYTQRRPVTPELDLLAPWIFLAFAVGFAGYRFALVAARRYSPFKAFFQVFTAALFFMLLLWPGLARPPGAPGVTAPSGLLSALASGDAEKRALAAEVAGHRRDVAVAPALVRLLTDDAPAVRNAAHAALVQLNDGVDLGAADDPAARAAWTERFK